ARAQETGEPDDLTGLDGEVVGLDAAVTTQARGREDGWCVGALGCRGVLRAALDRVERGALTTDHEPDELPSRQLCGEVLADEASVAQDRQPVGDLVDLVEEVGDEEDG